MCIIVDINTFAEVFTPSSKGYTHYSIVGKHIRSNKSKLIIGGTKFLSELSYVLPVLEELKIAGQVVTADTSEVDKLYEKIKARSKDSRFNDEHIVALSCVTHAKIVCTQDSNLSMHLRTRDFYNNGMDRPNIFNSKSSPKLIPQGGFKKTCLLCR